MQGYRVVPAEVGGSTLDLPNLSLLDDFAHAGKHPGNCLLTDGADSKTVPLQAGSDAGDECGHPAATPASSVEMLLHACQHPF